MSKLKFIPEELDDYRQDSRIVVMMTPDEFLSLAPIASEDYLAELKASGRDPRELFSKTSLDSITAAYLREEKMEVPFLDVDIKNCKVSSHEGRHRAFAAKELGIEEIPVRIYFQKRNREGFLRFIEHFGVDKNRVHCCRVVKGQLKCKLKKQH